MLTQGKVLIVENDGEQMMREALLIAVSHIFQTNAYEAYTLSRSQNLSFRIGLSNENKLQMLSQFIHHLNLNPLLITVEKILGDKQAI